LNDKALQEQLGAMIEKGERALQAAKDHLSKSDADFASSKAYYAVFHLMQAILLTKGLTFSKHAGVISGFSEHFIKSGIFPSEFGGIIQKLRKDRELGDYGYQMRVSLEEAGENVEVASQVLEQLKARLQLFMRGE